MSPVCPRCGGELRPASINAWVHVWQDKEDDCYMRGKDGSEVRASLLATQDSESPVPANPDDVVPTKEPLPTTSATSVGDSLPSPQAVGRTLWTTDSLKRALQQRTVPEQTYRRLLSWATTYASGHVFRTRNGAVLLSVTSEWTDAEITEALR